MCSTIPDVQPHNELLMYSVTEGVLYVPSKIADVNFAKTQNESLHRSIFLIANISAAQNS
jgi:hypothetical protein